MMRTLFRFLSIGILLLSVAPAWAEQSKGVQSIDDLYYGEAFYHYYIEEYFTSITKLMVGQDEQHLTTKQEEAELLLGGLYLSYGMHDEASRRLERLLHTVRSPHVRNQAWFFLAKVRYQRGMYKRAMQALDMIDAPLKADSEPERQVLALLLHMALGTDKKLKLDTSIFAGSTLWDAYGRYNQAMVMLRQGLVEQDKARIILESLTVLPEESDAEWEALAQRAYLSLGLNWLREDPEKARGYFQKMDIDGHLGNKALLGSGWSSYRMGFPGKTIVPWLTLLEGSIVDVSVLQAMEAFPFILSELNADRQARMLYLRAIVLYEGQISAIDKAINKLPSNAMLEQLLELNRIDESGWFWHMDRVVDDPLTPYLQHLFSSHGFQESFKAYRDVHFMLNKFQLWEEELDTFEMVLDERRAAYQRQEVLIQQEYRPQRIEQLVQRHRDMKKRIQSVARANDPELLASGDEQALMKRLNDLQTRIHSAGTNERLMARLKVLRGELVWRYSHEYKERLWNLRKVEKELAETVEQVQRNSDNLQQAWKNAPAGFQGFKGRIEQQRAVLAEQRKEAQRLAGRLREALNHQIKTELERVKAIVIERLAQVRFDLAQLHDENYHREVQP